MASSPLLETATELQPQKPLKGCVNTFYRHYKGRRLGPYFVRRWKIGRKVYREYIKPADVERVRAACQAYRESRRGINTFIDNFDFLGKMMNRFDKDKVVSPAMGNYILRLRREGMYISGRPPMRRKITRQLAYIDGEPMTIKTVFELDGTTKVFMVPFFTNRFRKRVKTFEEWLSEIANEAWNKAHPDPNSQKQDYR